MSHNIPVNDGTASIYTSTYPGIVHNIPARNGIQTFHHPTSPVLLTNDGSLVLVHSHSSKQQKLTYITDVYLNCASVLLVSADSNKSLSCDIILESISE